MKTKELFVKDPLAWKLINDGVSSNNTEDHATLMFELDTFVCEGEYLNGMRRILESYLAGFKGPQQKAAWISGFYGSGKSHLAKVLRYLWADFVFPSGETARSIAHLPVEIKDLLVEISALGKRHGGLHMAGGTLKSGTGSVRLRVLDLVFKSVGLPEGYLFAKFVMDLKRDLVYEDFVQAIQKLGKNADGEILRLYSSPTVAKAYAQVYGVAVAGVGETLLASYPPSMTDITIANMCATLREAITVNRQLPCTLVVLDEVQQFIGSDDRIALDVQEVTEALSGSMDGRVIVVATGQSGLSDTPNLQRLMGRFTLKCHLKDNDVEKVVRTVVLQKRDDKKPAIKALIAKHEGEITRQLKATKFATATEDEAAFVPDFPLLPVRRRFWEKVLRSVDATGTTAQMRTQLSVVHAACQAYGEEELGAVVPADFIYDQIANDLVSSGEMQRRFQEMIELQSAKPDGALRRRICALIFLINKLPREDGTDSGVRAEAEHLADLLSNDLAIGSTLLRQQVPQLLAALVSEGVLQQDGSEHRLQTTEGAAWQTDFNRFRAAALNNQPLVAAQLNRFIGAALASSLGNPSVVHGDCKERRRIAVHHGEDRPDGSSEISLWVRDGFSALESTVLGDIRKLSTDDSTLHLFLPKAHADEFKTVIAAAQAAEEVLNLKGVPSSPEGKECLQAMRTRKAGEQAKIDDLVAEILAGARLFLSGGQELACGELKQATEDASKQVLSRLYPKFQDGDSARWHQAYKKALEGSANALEQVGHNGDPHTHPVAAAILLYLGAGKTGLEVRNKFSAAPYGWPQDAMDAVLTALLASSHLSARIKGTALLLNDIDQKKLGQAAFVKESPVLTVQEKIAIRKLFMDGGLPRITAGNELADAAIFIAHAKAAAAQAGGDAPAPMAPAAPQVLALEAQSGNELLLALFEQRAGLLEKLKAWQATGKEIAKRRPPFDLTEKLVAQAAGLAGQEDWAATLGSIRANRSLLDEPDPVSRLLNAVANALRANVSSAHKQHAEMFAAQAGRIGKQPAWQALPEAKRNALLADLGAVNRPAPNAGVDAQLSIALQDCSLQNWRAQTDALPAQFDNALAAAIVAAEPKARRVTLGSATIHNQAELDAWMKEALALITAALKDGPVIL